VHHRYQRHRWQILPLFSLVLLIPLAASGSGSGSGSGSLTHSQKAPVGSGLCFYHWNHGARASKCIYGPLFLVGKLESLGQLNADPLWVLGFWYMWWTNLLASIFWWTRERPSASFLFPPSSLLLPRHSGAKLILVLLAREPLHHQLFLVLIAVQPLHHQPFLVLFFFIFRSTYSHRLSAACRH